jgi:hypothetical protein
MVEGVSKVPDGRDVSVVIVLAWGLSRRLLNLADRGGSDAQHTALATVVRIAEARS